MTDRNDDLFSAARAAIPGGVNSPVRAYGSVGGTPRFLASAKGARVTDAAGREYVDLVASWGPALLGHAHPEIVAAVQEAASRGLSFGAPTEGEVELATLIADRVRFGEVRPVERVRLVSTGTEATMTAIRLARGATGRDLLVKFAGHYHGHSDGLLAEAGSGVATLALPGSAGVPAPIAAQTLVIGYNDPDALAAVFAEHGQRIAAVIVEASAANMGVVAPMPGFNRLIAETAHAHGALMIIDEVLTGFRVHPAGFWGLQAAAGEDYLPDIFTFGKGRRRGDAVGGAGWTSRDHGPAGSARTGVPGRDAVREPALGRCGARDAAARDARGLRDRRRGCRTGVRCSRCRSHISGCDARGRHRRQPVQRVLPGIGAEGLCREAQAQESYR